MASGTKKTKKSSTSEMKKNDNVGQDKCPKCGATDISLNVKIGMLRCNYCRHEFSLEKTKNVDIDNLVGEVFSEASEDIDENKNIITLKCESCGSEVVVDTSENTQKRCHWCRNTLSIDSKVPNGAVPDIVLPFKVEKNDARKQISYFVDKRKFFANKKFKKEFTTENIVGVYLPYIVVDVNAHAKFSGLGEHQTREYRVGTDEHERTVYDADEYTVSRDYDLVINGLTIESSKDKLNNSASDKTNNIINAIMPFDIENCVNFKSNFLKGFTSEKRSLNVADVKNLVEMQSKDIARFAANESLTFYDRGVKFTEESLEIIGSNWKTAYLPVWIYSYQEVKANKKTLHYVAVNARTKETMGSIPVDVSKLFGYSCLVEFFAFMLMGLIDFDYNFIFLAAGVIFYIVNYNRYRNQGERHRHELETHKEVTNMVKVDEFKKHKKGLESSKISGANNFNVNGSYTKK